jgi:hypothetical protein
MQFYSNPFLAQRALAACWAISLRLSGDNFVALALPPFNPPSLPSATAAGFFLLGREGNCTNLSDFGSATDIRTIAAAN